ncbi:hypothetical protein GCM10007269_31260 [Microbacterium murale]|uniref:CAAX prenyl protease 2/Lysostaphin resistance protein A-like domain-containing protein n=1 Tax=Microbacterium murale TaxID=1081040 RepID=A0ABQ1RY80_9MICO|nr:hypothetical protein GCM10007269_31260 [Microbacterium murale]
MVEVERGSGWTRYWNHGNWWKALILVAVYWGVYQLVSLGTSTLFGPFIDADNVLSSPLSILLAVALPILIMGGLLLLLAFSLGWSRELFARQPLRGRPWMWIAVVLVIIPIILRLIATNWSAYSVATVFSLLFLGLCVGFAEEVLTRGFVVNMLRKGGAGEKVVFLLSSVYFAALHSGNIVSGQAPLSVLLIVIYTFGFGAMMYLSLRATGSIVWVILLHAATDPITILATGGIDAHSATTAGSDGLIGIAGIFNFVYIALGLLAIILVKNRHEGSTPVPHDAGQKSRSRYWSMAVSAASGSMTSSSRSGARPVKARMRSVSTAGSRFAGICPWLIACRIRRSTIARPSRSPTATCWRSAGSCIASTT